MNASRSVSCNNTWTVNQVHFVGVAKSTSGELTNLLQFQAELRSTESTCLVEVEVDARALDRLLKRLATGTSVHGQSSKGAQPRTIAKLIQELLTIDLSFEDSDRWDPVRSPRWRLEETGMAPVSEGSLKDDGNERHSNQRFLTFVGNIFRST
jgi:hypothetical protein